jgi:GNAT superfamily N-acetyltransferase
VDSLACPGCARRPVCESRPSWLADSLTHEHAARDGRPVLLRPLLYQDRAELEAAYLGLSMRSRRFRFFSAPERLRPAELEYLTNLDYRDHVAWAAFAVDEPGRPGLGVARYIRLPAAPGCAEAAVTVVDHRQGCGVGTLLLEHLAGSALTNGVTTFVTYVLWANAPAIEALEEIPARISSDEPGIARLELDLLPPERAGRGATPVLAGLLRLIAGLQVGVAGASGAPPGRRRSSART